jgi:hypothetical protein
MFPQKISIDLVTLRRVIWEVSELGRNSAFHIKYILMYMLTGDAYSSRAPDPIPDVDRGPCKPDFLLWIIPLPELGMILTADFSVNLTMRTDWFALYLVLSPMRYSRFLRHLHLVCLMTTHHTL